MSPATALQPAAGARANARGGAPLVVPNPFVRASEEQFFPFDDRSILLSAANPTQVGPIDVPATGYLRHIVVLVEASGGVGGANNVQRKEDGPWCVLRDISLTDTNGAQIVGPLDGFEIFLTNRWGAYSFETDPEQGPEFVDVVSGAGASGNFAFMLRIPVEIAGRDALGALPNMNSSNTYKLSYTLAQNTALYSVAPATTQPTVRIRCGIEAWAPPPPADQRGVPNITVPPAMGTTQNWTRTQVNVNAGEQRIRLPRVGQLIRTLVAVFRNVTPIRVTADLPDPLRIELDRNVLTNEWKAYRRRLMRERYTQPLDTWDAGVLVWDFTHDLDYKPGNEMRDLYLPTSPATAFEFLGAFGNAGTLTILTNDVSPAGDVFTEAN